MEFDIYHSTIFENILSYEGFYINDDRRVIASQIPISRALGMIKKPVSNFGYKYRNEYVYNTQHYITYYFLNNNTANYSIVPTEGKLFFSKLHPS